MLSACVQWNFAHNSQDAMIGQNYCILVETVMREKNAKRIHVVLPIVNQHIDKFPQMVSICLPICTTRKLKIPDHAD